MTDYEYIYKQAKKYYFTIWPEDELRKCVDMLQNLEREELVALQRCKWIKKVMKEEIFNILYKFMLGEREKRIKQMSTEQLIDEFENRSSGNISLIREELRHRYKDGMGDDRIKIAAVFQNGTKGDQKWLELQLRREMNGCRKMIY